MATLTGPIADLSYRNYDGPMGDIRMRWWVIAKMFMRMAIKRKGFWWWALLSTMGYIFLSVVYYFMDALQERAAGFSGQSQINFLDRIVWKDQFYMAFDMSQLWLFFLALLIGAGMIAADTRANALLVYLSKPCTKLDYLLGKWLGMFLVILAVTGIPAILFLGFTWLSYRRLGSWDSWMVFRVLILVPVPAILHASVMLGISSMFNQPRLAGATYAGVYFLSMFVAGIATGLSFASRDGGVAIRNFGYFSIDGIIEGISKIVLSTNGAVNLIPSRERQALGLEAPSGLFITLLFLIVCGTFLSVAWKRVRAVEVVGS